MCMQMADIASCMHLHHSVGTGMHALLDSLLPTLKRMHSNVEAIAVCCSSWQHSKNKGKQQIDCLSHKLDRVVMAYMHVMFRVSRLAMTKW